MDHRPYSDWLLDDEHLSPEQERDLRIHLRSCPECAALTRGNLALRAAPVLAAPQDFALRFALRLAAQRKVQRQRSLIGLFFLALIGLSGVLWVLLPYLSYLALPPTQLVGLWISSLVYILLTVRALAVMSVSLMNIVQASVPVSIWFFSMLMLGGAGFLWAFSLRRVGKYLVSAG